VQGHETLQVLWEKDWAEGEKPLTAYRLLLGKVPKHLAEHEED
jgi:hypothetical protein